MSKTSGKKVKIVGSNGNELLIQELIYHGKRELDRLIKSNRLANFKGNCVIEQALVAKGRNTVRKIGPEIIFGRIYNNLGFTALNESLFRHLVIASLAYPWKKFNPTEYLYHFHDVILNMSEINLFLEKLSNRLKKQAERIVWGRRLNVSGNMVSILLCKVATIRPERERQPFLKTVIRRAAVKQGPEFYAALLIDAEGVTGYEIFESNVMESKKLIHFIENICKTRNLGRPIIVARKGLLSNKNLNLLKEKGYEYIVGAALENAPQKLINEIQEKHPEDEQLITLIKKNNRRLVITYSAKKAEKDECKRKRDIKNLQKKIESGEFSKSCNKYMKLDEEGIPGFNYEEFNCSKARDGLRGCITNSRSGDVEVVLMYRKFLRIGKKFSLSVNDPCVNRDSADLSGIRKRIEARVCIAFMAYQVYKEFETALQKEKIGLSMKRSVELTRQICQIDYFPVEPDAPESRILKMDSRLERLFQVITENK